MDPLISEAQWLSLGGFYYLLSKSSNYYRNEEKFFPIYFRFVNSVPGKALLILRE